MLRIWLLLCFVAACSGNDAKVVKQPNSDDASTVETPSEPVVVFDTGNFQCQLQWGQQDESGGCQVEQQGDERHFLMQHAAVTIAGTVTPTRFGMRFTGQVEFLGQAKSELNAEFFKQGKHGFASVLRLADGTLAKLTVLKVE